MKPLDEILALAATHAAQGRPADAIVAYREALLQRPAFAELYHNIGTLSMQTGELDAAERAFAEAARRKPRFVAPSLALGHLYYRQQRFADAEQAFEHAASLDPDSVEALFNLAMTRDRLRRWAEAIPPLREARTLAPDNAAVWFALRGHLLTFNRDLAAHEDFLAFAPHAKDSVEVAIAGLQSARLSPDPAFEVEAMRRALAFPYRPGDSPHAAVLVGLAQYFDLPREEFRRIYGIYDALQQAERGDRADLADWRAGERPRIRVGYLSGDFRTHVMGDLMLDLFRRHDRSRFEVYAYSLGAREFEDAQTGEFRASCEQFTRLDDRDDESGAQMIAADRLDILVDLMSHSAWSRPRLLAMKPAPVIVTHLGHHAAIGVSQVDFKLTDRHADLPDAGGFQIERPLPIDTCVLPVRRVAAARESPVSRADLGIADDAPVFGVFVSLTKLSPRCLGLWREILDAVPESVLAFSPMQDVMRPAYLARLAGFGIAAERIRFVPWARDDARDRARYRLVDIVLDTMPYTGGDTTAAALDMAVPVVTRVGERHAERMSYSLLAHLGVTDTLAHTDAGYVAIACSLARDREARRAISETIATRLPASGLSDYDRYTRSLEAAYERAIAIRSART